MFDRFYRGQQQGSSTIPGTGLGLGIVKEIINLHQGKIEVDSKIGEGAIVSEFSSTSHDESDIFTDPRIQRIPEIAKD
ncbi:MAG: ATP-binding protein [Chloroflexi bacterium]|nr:MAG: ATP-binding protein [Chloroflexota bacterium]